MEMSMGVGMRRFLLAIEHPSARQKKKARPRRRTGPPPYSTTSTRKTRTLLQSECAQIDSNPVPSVCKSEVVPLGHPACANYLLRASYRRAAGAGAASWPGFLGAGAIPLTEEVDFPRKPKMH